MIDPILSRSDSLGTLGTVELRIPAQAEWVAVARLTVSAVASRLPFSVEDIEDLKLALTEACANCIQAAAGSDETDAIEIVFEALADEIHVTVRDHRRARTETLSSRARDERTEELGIYIIRSLMDVVEYRTDVRSGTELMMVKRVPTS